MKRIGLPTKRIAFQAQVSEPASEKQKSDRFTGRLFCNYFANLLICKAICLVVEYSTPDDDPFAVLRQTT